MDFGIRASRPDKELTKNTAPGRMPGADLADTAAGGPCASNVWEKNVLGTANDPCIG